MEEMCTLHQDWQLEKYGPALKDLLVGAHERDRCVGECCFLDGLFERVCVTVVLFVSNMSVNFKQLFNIPLYNFYFISSAVFVSLFSL